MIGDWWISTRFVCFVKNTVVKAAFEPLSSYVCEKRSKDDFDPEKLFRRRHARESRNEKSNQGQARMLS